MSVAEYLAREAARLGHPLSVSQERAVVAELVSQGVIHPGRDGAA